MYSDGEEFHGRSGRRGGGRAGAAPGSAVGSGQSGSRAAGLSVGPGSSEFRGAAGGSDSRDWRSRKRGGEASPPRTPSPARVSGAEPVSELALSSALRQPARRKRASPEAPAPAASASSESDSDRSAKGLNPSAAPFSPLPASSRSAGSRRVRQEPAPGPVSSSLSPLVECEQGDLTSAPGRFEIYRASDYSPPTEGEFDDVRRSERLDVVQSREHESRIRPKPAWRGERRQSMLALALRRWSTWALDSAQRRARVSLLSRQRATARLAWVAWKARADRAAHQRELQRLAFQAWKDVTQQVAQLQGLFVRGSRRRVESAFAAWRQRVVRSQGLWRRGSRRRAGAAFMAWHQQTMLAKERSTWWVGARSHRMTQMVRRCLREWRRLPRTTPVSSDSSQGTSARRPVGKAGTSSDVSSCSDSDQESWWRDIRRGLKRLGKDHPLSGVMWFQFKDHGLSDDGAYRLEIHQQSVSESKGLMQQKREDPHNSLGRCRFSAFAINVSRPGEIVRRGVDLQELPRLAWNSCLGNSKRVKELPRSAGSPISALPRNAGPPPSEQRAVEERWAADRLAAEARETARQLAVDESVAQQVAADERRAADRRSAEAQLEERLVGQPGAEGGPSAGQPPGPKVPTVPSPQRQRSRAPAPVVPPDTTPPPAPRTTDQPAPVVASSTTPSPAPRTTDQPVPVVPPVTTPPPAPQTADQASPEPPEDEIDETVSPEIWQQLRDLEKEFAHVICTELPDSVQSREYKAGIRLRPDWNGNPLHRRGYKLSQEELRQLRQQLDELLAKGYIRPSASPWGCPVLMVPKPSNPKELRLVIDYRQINEITTIKDKYPLPDVQSLLDDLQGATVFSTMDALWGFMQVPMGADDVEKTAMTTHFGARIRSRQCATGQT
ncbi:hypothetical protein CYMTET_36770 [Cymbomonas tetramitiformis]|uniref:Reverse transcriptase domain-containing protein n=1 Tax=Cymbomonas tetramitiformis TaxID=36881 RepID=A0AAE0F7B0_9CHLO|nr:hypothetical protein CYMTET_36770 [Cymbomonas tetramitiformis]